MGKSGHIFVIGYMLAGKTTYGKTLAHQRNLPFFDLDTQIEANKGKSISTIFNEDGESLFRQLEHDILNELCQSPTPSVISCGGGTPCFHDNLNLMKQFGTVIYLRTPLSIILKRALLERQNRPLLAQIPDTQLTTFITNQLAEREKFYLQADKIITPPTL